jgi:hypothetical protein
MQVALVTAGRFEDDEADACLLHLQHELLDQRVVICDLLLASVAPGDVQCGA